MRRADKRLAGWSFSGVGKTAEEMDMALHAGDPALQCRESSRKLHCWRSAPAKLRKKARVALRVNPDVFAETHPYISTGLRRAQIRHRHPAAAREVYARAAKSSWLRSNGGRQRAYRFADPQRRALWRRDGTSGPADPRAGDGRHPHPVLSMRAAGWASNIAGESSNRSRRRNLRSCLRGGSLRRGDRSGAAKA